MSFVRPEAASALARWSEVLASLLIVALGLWAATGAGWLLQSLGVGILLIGLGLAFTAFRRMQFGQFSGGVGVVDLDERQLSYFAAFDGGAVSLDMLARVTIITGPRQSAAQWFFEEDGGGQLLIPANAAEADLLFDALAALPGVDYDAATKALSSRADQQHVIWSKERAQLH